VAGVRVEDISITENESALGLKSELQQADPHIEEFQQTLSMDPRCQERTKKIADAQGNRICSEIFRLKAT
jgi:hypothetical protein